MRAPCGAWGVNDRRTDTRLTERISTWTSAEHITRTVSQAHLGATLDLELPSEDCLEAKPGAGY